MAVPNSTWSIRALSPSDVGFLPALHLAVTSCPQVSKSVAQPVQALFDSQSLNGLQLRPVVGAYNHNILRVAVVGVESPGASNLLLVPFDINSASDAEGGMLALRCARELSGEYGVLLSQVIGPERPSNWDAVLRESGFTRLTELMYMTRSDNSKSKTVPAPRRWSDRWVRYSTEVEPLFYEALERSYAQSRDCPELTYVRTVRQSLSSHRAAGIFDPSTWFVLANGDQPLGVLLLSQIRGEPVTEIVYMGVSQLARGSGVGDLLMEQALRITSANATSLILAVDARNEPARRLYARWGFVEIARRAAWIANVGSIGP